MKQFQNKTLLWAAAGVLLLAGCSEEPLAETSGEGMQICLSIDGEQIPSASMPRDAATRAGAVNESAVNDLWVLQFQMTAGSTTEGTLVRKSYTATVTDPANVNFRFKSGDNMAVYLVANSGDATLFKDGTTLAAVKAQSIPMATTAGNNFPSETSASLPMVGQSATLTFPAVAAVPVTLTRVVSKIVLTIKNLHEEDYPRITVSSVQLKNVPKAYSPQAINTTNGFDGSTDANRFPAAAAANFTSYTAVAGNIPATGTTFTWFMTPNVRGIGSNTDPRLKSDLTAPSGQGDYATYIEILGTAKATSTSGQTHLNIE